MPEETGHRSEGRGRLGRLWDRLPGGRTGRALFAAGAMVLVVLIFLVVPGLIASQPSFYAGFPTTAKEYRTWTRSVHVVAQCQNCHVAPDWAAQAVWAARLPGEFYLSLFPGHQPGWFAKPTNPACQSCHTDLRKVSPSGDLNIPHRAHVTVLHMQCITCHKYLVHKTNPQGDDKPTMVTCLVCHNGRTAKNSCSACHTEKALPVSHRAADWLVVHPQMQKKIDCAKCHKWTSNWCAQCHATRPRSHTKTWRVDHGKAVARHRDCEVCHQASFCIRCHGELPRLDYDPNLKPVK